MDWIAMGTLVAALVAAVGAVWAALISQRQLTFARKAAELPLPLVTARAGPVDHRPNWTSIHVEMSNRAQVPIDVLTISFMEPADAKMLLEKQVYREAEHEWDPKVPLDVFPVDKATSTVPATAYLDRRGGSQRHGPGEYGFVTLFAHLPLSRFEEAPHPRLNLEMRWRDHTTKTFAMAVNIIKPNTA